MKFLALSTFFLAAVVQAEEPERAGTAAFEQAYNDLRAATIGSGLTETEQALYIEMMEGRDVSSCGCTNNDPHVYTYDGVHSECQGKGDFIYSMSKTTDFMVQARFSIEGTWSNWNAFTRERSDERFFGTATKGAVVNTGYPNEPKVEAFAGTRINSGNRNDVANCEMQWYFDDVKIDDMAKMGGHDGHGIYDLGWGIFWRSGKKRYIFFRESGLWMEYDKWAWKKWGCAVNVCVCPSEKIRKTGLIGILGTADGDKNNEYTKRDGSPLPTQSQGGFEHRDPKMIWEHNQYCREQWCLGDDDIENIFKTPINNCEGDPSHKLDVAVEGASEELKELCLYNQECIEDAIVANDAGLGVRTLEEIKEQHEHKVDPNRHCEDNQEADECAGLKFERYNGNKVCKRLGYDLGFRMNQCDNNKAGDFLNLVMTGTKVGATCDASTNPGSFEIECGEKINNRYKDFKVTPSVDTVVKVRGQQTSGNGGLYYKELKAGVEYTLNDGGAEYIRDIEFCFMCDQLPDPPCPNENKVCHDGTVLNRLAPSCDFAECPPCPADELECPDGTMLARDFGDSCSFPECPPCDDDTFTCPNGDVLVRDASNCEFPLCGPCDVLTKECPGGEVLEVNVDTCDFADCPTPDAEPEPEISTRAFTKGDPHFMTFGGEMYDFHGECDLVLLHNPQFKNGLGMDIHIRTKISDWWSSVETAAVKIGNDTLEITGAGSKFLWINGKENEDMVQGVFYKSTMAGYLVRYRIKGAVREAHIHFGSKDHHEKLVIRAYKEFVRVDVDYEGSDSYVGSAGLLGSRDLDGLRVGRDMKTLIQNHNEFGQEWQVREDEPKLFHSNEGAVQAPNKCILPVTTAATTQLRRRRLAESGLSMNAIEVACSHLTSPAERKGCVDDVVATQDMDMAAVW